MNTFNTMHNNDRSRGASNGMDQNKKIYSLNDLFHSIAQKVSIVMASHWAFIVAVLVIVLWGVSGPLFDFSNTWQLIINTTTTVVTFLMVFLIQNTQNRDAKAMHLKLDELIRSIRSARNQFVDIESISDKELQSVENEFKQLHKQAESQAQKKVS